MATARDAAVGVLPGIGPALTIALLLLVLPKAVGWWRAGRKRAAPRR